MSAPADTTPEEIIREHPEAESDPAPPAPQKKKDKKKSNESGEMDSGGKPKVSGGKSKASGEAARDQKVTGEDQVVKPSALKLSGKAQVTSSEVVFKGAVFHVTRDQVAEPGGVVAQREVAEPGGVVAQREVVRHQGSVVVLAVDKGKSRRNPNILLIRQYRHAAGQFLLELPAGRIEAGEKLIPAAKRELIEETGYRAKKWSKHVTYFASPGFLSEAMNILLAEDLTLGEAQPEDDERIELHMTPLKDVLKLIHEGKIPDGKTLIGVLYYASLLK